jgi:hypothetical protein
MWPPLVESQSTRFCMSLCLGIRVRHGYDSAFGHPRAYVRMDLRVRGRAELKKVRTVEGQPEGLEQ